MIYKGVLPRLILALILLIIVIVVGSLCYAHDLYVFSLIAAIVTLCIFTIVIKLFSYNTQKATFMFNAIENDDYAFQFAQNVRSRNDKMYNSSLNRIKDIMQKTRTSIIEREQYYETILSHSSCGIIVVDPSNGVVFQTNRAAMEILGVTSLTHINQLAIVSEDVPQAILDIVPLQNRTVNFYNETSQVHLSLTASMAMLNNRLLKIIAMSDIGGQLDNEQTESWVRLSRVLTHEIMNSLSPITSLSEQLRTTTDPITLHHGLEIIGTTGKGLMDFVDSYRRLTRIPTPDIIEFSIFNMLQKQVGLFDAKKIDLSGVNPSVHLAADENLITQVVTNLIKNAIEATTQYGTIWINSRIDYRGRTIIEVCNSGEPISEDVRENIFVPFFTTKNGGSGIGLSLSRQIMRVHNGSITYTNKLQKGKNVTIFALHF